MKLRPAAALKHMPLGRTADSRFLASLPRVFSPIIVKERTVSTALSAPHISFTGASKTCRIVADELSVFPKRAAKIRTFSLPPNFSATFFKNIFSNQNCLFNNLETNFNLSNQIWHQFTATSEIFTHPLILSYHTTCGGKQNYYTPSENTPANPGFIDKNRRFI